MVRKYGETFPNDQFALLLCQTGLHANPQQKFSMTSFHQIMGGVMEPSLCLSMSLTVPDMDKNILAIIAFPTVFAFSAGR
jgi:hypothetical protein